MLIYVTGPPGSGKSTLCRRLSEEFHGTHISIGDLLRRELDENTSLGSLISTLTGDGPLASTESFLPSSVILAVIRKHFENRIAGPVFIDGYPVNMENYARGPPLPGQKVAVVVNLITSRHSSIKRCRQRNRPHETAEVITKRFSLFIKETLPVIEHLRKNHPVIELCTDRDTSDNVFQKVKDKLERQVLE